MSAKGAPVAPRAPRRRTDGRLPSAACVRACLVLGATLCLIALSAPGARGQDPPAPPAQATPPPPQSPTPPQPGAPASQPPRDVIVPGWARVSFFATTARSTSDTGDQSSLNEIVSSLAWQSPLGERSGIEYKLDVRFSGYPSAGAQRSNRTSIYEASVTGRIMDGRVGFQAGQIFLSDLGALGSVGGFLTEVRRPKRAGTLRLKIGAFGGLEPQVLQVGYAPGIRKFGGYMTLEGEGARRHTIGYVNLRNQGLTERSVVVVNNFVPVGRKFFLYQAAEYDVAAQGGLGSKGLTYFFANTRVMPTPAVEIMGNFHRGRSIDARTIAEQQLSGRPIDQRSLDGFLFESVGGRVTVRVARGIRVFGGYAQDRNNRDDQTTGRVSAGVFASDVLHSGIDVNVTDSRIDRGTAGSHDSWYVSIGRTFVRRVYLSGDFTSSLSTINFTTSTGFVVSRQPRTKRMGLSSTTRVSRAASLLLNVDRTTDTYYSETRMLAGISYRF